jgi:hypothetical protein
MKTSKKILILIITLLIVGGLSGLAAWAIVSVFGGYFFPMFTLSALTLLFGHAAVDKLAEIFIFRKKLVALSNRPFRDYLLNLMCQHCSHVQPVAIDLQDSDFICTKCERRNGIHTTITTAAVTEIQEAIKL